MGQGEKPGTELLESAEDYLLAVTRAHLVHAGVLADPKRAEDIERYYRAIFGALNETHDEGEQDGLCVIAGLATMLGQLVGGFPEDDREGFLVYALAVARGHAEKFAQEGTAARNVVEADAEFDAKNAARAGKEDVDGRVEPGHDGEGEGA